MSEDSYGNVDQSELVFRAVDRLGQTMSGGFQGEEEVDMDLYLFKVRMSLRMLESLVTPYKDDDYDTEKEAAEEVLDDSRFSKTSTTEKLDYIQVRLNAVMNLLARRNMLYEAETQINDPI